MAGNTAYSAIGHCWIFGRDFHASFGVNIDGVMGDKTTVAAFTDDKRNYFFHSFVIPRGSCQRNGETVKVGRGAESNKKVGSAT